MVINCIRDETDRLSALFDKEVTSWQILQNTVNWARRRQPVIYTHYQNDQKYNRAFFHRITILRYNRTDKIYKRKVYQLPGVKNRGRNSKIKIITFSQ